jgi:hypothetical protein
MMAKNTPVTIAYFFSSGVFPFGFIRCASAGNLSVLHLRKGKHKLTPLSSLNLLPELYNDRLVILHPGFISRTVLCAWITAYIPDAD